MKKKFANRHCVDIIIVYSFFLPVKGQKKCERNFRHHITKRDNDEHNFKYNDAECIRVKENSSSSIRSFTFTFLVVSCAPSLSFLVLSIYSSLAIRNANKSAVVIVTNNAYTYTHAYRSKAARKKKELVVNGTNFCLRSNSSAQVILSIRKGKACNFLY